MTETLPAAVQKIIEEIRGAGFTAEVLGLSEIAEIDPIYDGFISLRRTADLRVLYQGGESAGDLRVTLVKNVPEEPSESNRGFSERPKVSGSAWDVVERSLRYAREGAVQAALRSPSAG